MSFSQAPHTLPAGFFQNVGEELDRSGFIHVQGAVHNVDQGLAAQCRGVTAEHDRNFTVFNYNHDRGDDFKRSQTHVQELKDVPAFQPLQACISAFQATLENLLVGTSYCSPQISDRRTVDWVVLHSEPGCQSQQPHTDYDPEKVKLAERNNGSCAVPLGVICAIEPGTMLVAYPGSHLSGQQSVSQGLGLPQIVHFEAGDLVLFRGDFVHAGAAYSSYGPGNVRLHAYLDVFSPGSAEPLLERQENTTYPTEA